jgi:aspartate kinase
MARLIQKFGGSSLCDSKHIQNAARIVADTAREGKELVVVVSAMGDSTDRLIELAGEVADGNADPRELDVLLATGEQVSIAMMSLALQNLGLKARSFSGPQAGILTDDAHGYARIKTVQASRLEASLRRQEIAVVAGFQGMTCSSELTTLGRGGSDTTAVALATALKAECCDIYTDVDGIYTTDPRTVGNARKLRAISYEEMLAMASAGAQVLNARSVELAMKNSVPIRLRSTFHPSDTGTLVTNRALAPEYQICGVACDCDRISMKLSLSQDFSAGNHYDSERQIKVSKLVSELEHLGIPQSAVFVRKSDGLNVSEIEFTCEKRLARPVQSLITTAMAEFPDSRLWLDAGIARISIIGCAVDADTRLRGALLDTLASAEIPVSMLTSDKLSLCAVVPDRYKDEALREVHARFCQESPFTASPLVRT